MTNVMTGGGGLAFDRRWGSSRSDRHGWGGRVTGRLFQAA